MFIFTLRLDLTSELLPSDFLTQTPHALLFSSTPTYSALVILLGLFIRQISCEQLNTPFCKWQGRVADDSRPPSAEVKNVWGCTSSLPHAFEVYRDKNTFTFTCCFIHRYDTWTHALEHTLRKYLQRKRQKRIIWSFTTVLFVLYHCVSVIKSVRMWLAEDVERTQEMLNSHNNFILRREEMRPDGRSRCTWYKQRILRCWLDASGSEKRILDQLSNYKLLRKVAAPWSCLRLCHMFCTER